jgi:hypothetical protein
MGIALDTIQRYLGHASILTTAAYFNPDDQDALIAIRDLRFSN